MTLPSLTCDRGNQLCEGPTAFRGGACPGAKPQEVPGATPLRWMC